MLNSMRALSKGILAKLLMLLLVVSFGIWGVGDILRDSGPAYAIKVGSQTVSVAEFQRSVSRLKRQLEEVGIKDMKPAQLQMSASRQLVQQNLNLLTMEDVGLFVNNELVAQKVAVMKPFQDDTGKFSAKKFASILKSNGLSEKAFISQMKKDAAAEFLADSLSMEDATAPESVLTLETLANAETRDAVLLTIPARNALDEDNAAAITDYYEQNKGSLYMNPEARTLDYIVLTAEDINALIDAAITPEMMEKAKAASPDLKEALVRMKLQGEQRESVLHTLNNTIEDELAAGKKLDEALAKAGVKATPKTLANVTTDTAKMSSDDIGKTVAEQGFGMGEGEISGLIRTKNGTTLMVVVKSITPAKPKPFEAVKADVKTRLGKQLARDAARARAITVKEELSKSVGWQDVVHEQKLTSRIVSNIARPVEGGKAAPAGVPASLQQAIFEHEVGSVAGPLTMDNGDQLLALITASHLPDADSIDAKDKNSANVSTKLTRDIENRAYLSFTKRHAVIINPGLMRTPAPEAE